MPSQNVGTDTPSIDTAPITRWTAGRATAPSTPIGMATAAAITSDTNTSWSVAARRSPRIALTGRAYLYDTPQLPVSIEPSHFAYCTG